MSQFSYTPQTRTAKKREESTIFTELMASISQRDHAKTWTTLSGRPIYYSASTSSRNL
ncbi:hypothetical protein PGB90_005551 [Kerria lacca]